ncbi:glycosyltransferase [Natronosporangium hydrolyticum]|uniref:glycosyltransferase n=1 Tax=Natronosporangium hydrolyticum TaxID=2811111 RepID=UPI001EFA2123|nr:glycosyltransferase [Natronosporangium hydrolyticum]
MTTVLAVLGTDKHGFDRLVGWLESWHRTATAVRLLVQHGFSRPPTGPEAVDFLDHARLQASLREADLVVTHGGPATITEARRAGHLPIVVPRDPSRREHVDDHQQRFARRLAQDRMVVLCESEPALVAALRSGLDDPAGFRWRADPAESRLRAAAVARVGQIVEDLIAGDTGRPPTRLGGQR